MTTKIKRSSSAKDSIKKKVKPESKNTKDYTKLLTSEDVETIESGDEQQLKTTDKPEKIKSAKKAQTSNKKTLKVDKENGLLKKAKGKPKENTTNGKYFVSFFY